MEQLTTGEWASEQLKRAPSFAISAAIITAFLIISTFIEYAPARTPPLLPPRQAEIAAEEPETLEEIKDLITPERPELKPMKDVPVVDADVVPVDAPLDDITVDIDFTEDPTSDETEPKDPFPMDLAKKMAVIGSAPGTGGFRGALGNRSLGGRRRAARRFGMPRGTDKDILAALRWLKKAQEADGHWDGKKWGGGDGVDQGVTGLALLAFLGFGCTDKHPTEFAGTVRKAVSWLVQKQKATGTGSFGARMYSQGICTMALAEAYGMRIGGRPVRESAQAGLDYICRVQGANGGFGYTGAGDDTSVTGFSFQAIKAGLTVGLRVPSGTLLKCEKYLKAALNSDGSSPYRVPDANGKLSMTAAMLTGRLFLGHKPKAADCVLQARWLTGGGKHVQIGRAANDPYTTYYLCLSLFQMGGRYWKTWNAAFNKPLRARQERAGPNKGSWPHVGFAYGGHGGRVYTTAMACLSLEPYRFSRKYKSKSPGVRQ
jgi:hypothetical protein